MNRRSKKQESALTQRRNTGLDDAVSKDPGFSCQGLVGEFISDYLRCDLFATRLMNYYQADKQYKKTKLNTQALDEACRHFSLHFPKENILRLFRGGEGKRGEKSAKQLRNGYLHQLSKADRNEILEKSTEFTLPMKQLLKLRIKT